MGKLMKVLIIEDIDTDATLIELEVKKFLPISEFLCVETREDFISSLEVFQPDIILSDYSLPCFDGLSALKLAMERVPETPFIIITGSQNEDIAVDCMKAGAGDYVIKEHLKRLGSAILNSLEQKVIRVERRLALEALHESEERYRNLIEVAPIGITVHSEGKIVFANPSGVKLIGATCMKELIGRPVSELIHPDCFEDNQTNRCKD